MIKALLVQPLKPPAVIEIDNTIEALQEKVGGYVERWKLPHGAKLVCDEDAKLKGRAFNRSLSYAGLGDNTVSGDFVICNWDDRKDEISSLTPEQIEQYTEMFRRPEHALKIGNDLIPYFIDPDEVMAAAKRQAATSGTTYRIYQIKPIDVNAPGWSLRHDPTFVGLETLGRMGMAVDPENYKLVYTGDYTPGMTLESLYQKFNIDLPEDFRGHSLSISDVVVLSDGKMETAYFCDRVGFAKLDSFVTPESPKPPKRNRRKDKPPRSKGGQSR